MRASSQGWVPRGPVGSMASAEVGVFMSQEKNATNQGFFFFLESLLLNVYLAACHCQSSFLTSCTRPPPTQLPSRHRRVSPRGCSRRSWREPVVFLSFFFFLLFFFLVSFSWKKTAVVAVKILSIAKASSSRPCPGPSCKQGATYFSVQLHFRGP